MLHGFLGSRGHAGRGALAGCFACLLAGCSTVITSERVTRSGPTPGSFADAAVPTEIHGDIPGVTAATLSALYTGPNRAIASLSTTGLISNDVHVAFYLNRANLPDVAGLCDPGLPVTYAPQSGPVTKIVAVLCSGTTVLVRAEGSARLTGTPPEEVKERLDRFRANLFAAMNANGRYGGGNHS